MKQNVKQDVKQDVKQNVKQNVTLPPFLSLGRELPIGKGLPSSLEVQGRERNFKA